MSLWMSIVLLLALIKLPIAALMLWLPFRNDEAMRAPELPGASDDDGGSKAPPTWPRHPGPRRPSGDRPFAGTSRRPSPEPGSTGRTRRDPHRSPAPGAPRRIRTAGPGRRRVLD
jgi:hypothetical protein